MTYQGHLPDGSSVQRHSAGGLYPFVLFAKDSPTGLRHGYIDPRDSSEHLVGTYDETVAVVEQLIADRSEQCGLLACTTPVPEQQGNDWLRRARRLHESALAHEAFTKPANDLARFA